MDRRRRSILRNLLNGGRDLWGLAAVYPDRLATLCDNLKELERDGLILGSGSDFSLTPLGKRVTQKEGLVACQDVVCRNCSGRGVERRGLFEEAFRQFQEVAKSRPRAISNYDQGFVGEANTLERCLLMYERGDLEGSRVFLLGDDDLTGICMALTGLPRSVTIAEIDERIIDFSADIADRFDLPITVIQYDARSPLPREAVRAHDAFLTDPVETIPGIGLFLSRCAESLAGPGTAGYFGLTHLEASRTKWARIQRMILDMNFVITDALPFFNRYTLEVDEYFTSRLMEAFPSLLDSGAFPWYNSTMFRLEAVDEPLPLHTGFSQMGDEIYLDDDLRGFEPRKAEGI